MVTRQWRLSLPTRVAIFARFASRYSQLNLYPFCCIIDTPLLSFESRNGPDGVYTRETPKLVKSREPLANVTTTDDIHPMHSGTWGSEESKHRATHFIRNETNSDLVVNIFGQVAGHASGTTVGPWRFVLESRPGRWLPYSLSRYLTIAKHSHITTILLQRFEAFSPFTFPRLRQRS